MKRDARVVVLGAAGMVGSAVMRSLCNSGFTNIKGVTRAMCNLENAHEVFDVLRRFCRIDAIVLAAAKVGGIHANAIYPADFIMRNLAIQHNVLNAATEFKVKELCLIGSSCIYPKHCLQPMHEDYLLSGPLEPTNQPYAVAEIAGIEMMRAINRQCGTKWFAVIPSNLYGLGDRYEPEEDVHVIPALIKRFDDAIRMGEKVVVVWGSGRAMREFTYVDDCADTIVKLLRSKREYDLYNVGSGNEWSIMSAARIIAMLCGYDGAISFDNTHPDGTPRKLLNSSRAKAYMPRTCVPFEDGLIYAINDYRDRYPHAK